MKYITILLACILLMGCREINLPRRQLVRAPATKPQPITSPSTKNAEWARKELERAHRTVEEGLPLEIAKQIDWLEDSIASQSARRLHFTVCCFADDRVREAIVKEFRARGFRVEVDKTRVEIAWDRP